MSHQEEQNELIAGAVVRRLRARLQDSETRVAGGHLDADTIAAFVEGRIAEPGATEITTHLVVCSDCRRASAQVMHLEFAVPSDEPAEASTESTGRLRKLLDELATRVLPASEGDVVFAYEDRSAAPDSSDENPQDDSPADPEHEKQLDS